MTDLTLGQKVKKYRKRSGMSQLDLEVAIGASPGAISRIENDRVNPTKETIKNLNKALQLNALEAAELFGINMQNFQLELFKDFRFNETNSFDNLMNS